MQNDDNMIDHMEFAEEQRDLQLDVSNETLGVLKKYELVFTRITATQLMQASFMESMALSIGGIHEIQQRQLDLQIEQMRDDARDEKLGADDKVTPTMPSGDGGSEEKAPRKGQDPSDFMDAFFPGIGTFFGTLFGGAGALSVLGKAALGGLAISILSPVKDFIAGAVEGTLDGFGVSDQTISEMSDNIDHAVKTGLLTAFFGPKRALGAILGSLISNSVFDFFDPDDDGLVDVLGFTIKKEHVANIGAAIGFAIGAFLPRIIAKVIPAVLGSIGVPMIIKNAIRGSAAAAVSSLIPGAKAVGASFLAGSKAVASKVLKFGGPLATIAAIVSPDKMGNGELDVGLENPPENATPQELEAYVMEREQRSAAMPAPSQDVLNEEFDLIQDMIRQRQEAEAARLERLESMTRLRNEDLVMGAFVAPSSTEEELREQGRMTAQVSPEQAERIEIMLERNRTMSKVSVIEKSQPDASPAIISAPTNVGPTTRVTNNNSKTTIIQKTDPSRSLTTNPHFLPQ